MRCRSRRVRVQKRELGIVDIGDRVGDRLPVVRAGREALLDLDAIGTVCGEPVDDVPGTVAAEPLVRGRDAHWYAGAGDSGVDRRPDLLLERTGRCAADENLRGVGTMERDRMGKAPEDDRVEARETRFVNVGRRDVPAIEGASARLPPLAPPRADRLG